MPLSAGTGSILNDRDRKGGGYNSRMSQATDRYVQQNKDRLLEELKQFIRIPSISTLPENKEDIERAARFVADSLKAVGMENIEVIRTQGHPLVYADWLHAPGKPTVLCYGHYDVNPPTRWSSGRALRLSRPFATEPLCARRGG